MSKQRNNFSGGGQSFACLAIAVFLFAGCAHLTRNSTLTFSENQIQSYKKRAIDFFNSTVFEDSANGLFFSSEPELDAEGPVRFSVAFENVPTLKVSLPMKTPLALKASELTFRTFFGVTFDLSTDEILEVSPNFLWVTQEPVAETLESSVR